MLFFLQQTHQSSCNLDPFWSAIPVFQNKINEFFFHYGDNCFPFNVFFQLSVKFCLKMVEIENDFDSPVETC